MIANNLKHKKSKINIGTFSLSFKVLVYFTNVKRKVLIAQWHSITAPKVMVLLRLSRDYMYCVQKVWLAEIKFS